MNPKSYFSYYSYTPLLPRHISFENPNTGPPNNEFLCSSELFYLCLIYHRFFYYYYFPFRRTWHFGHRRLIRRFYLLYFYKRVLCYFTIHIMFIFTDQPQHTMISLYHHRAVHWPANGLVRCQWWRRWKSRLTSSLVYVLRVCFMLYNISILW